eukprot:TRINITY_DN14866_c0_g1_i3.p1 TRINITY_DN14866_c0_g1~~TRINITY_DN14866_c0_g1_i3.p1  ORF type:complete len:298 (+),score=39.15 TRINITY_DN14866_c0_g1_i3:38-931(+)
MIKRALKATLRNLATFSTSFSRTYYEDTGNYEYHQKLISMGYYFNERGILRSVKDNSPYKFTGDESAYESLCHAVTSFIQEVMIKDYNMIKADSIFLSNDFYSNGLKALVLIQGTGKVRPGVWSRYCCINESLEIGSMIPYIAHGKRLEHSAIILNPNNEYRSENQRPIFSMSDHCNSAWSKYIVKCPAKELFIVAHSAGGYCAYNLLKNSGEHFTNRVSAIALTDAMFGTELNDKGKEFVKNRVLQFAASEKAAGTELGEANGVRTVSAGHWKHEYTTGYARKRVFSFFQECVRTR